MYRIIEFPSTANANIFLDCLELACHIPGKKKVGFKVETTANKQVFPIPNKISGQMDFTESYSVTLTVSFMFGSSLEKRADLTVKVWEDAHKRYVQELERLQKAQDKKEGGLKIEK